MSRGLGRWERLLLHELYHNPRPPSPLCDVPSIRVGKKYTTTESENVAARRAARSLARKGLAVGGRCPGSVLKQVQPVPDMTCPECGRKCSEITTIAPISEHLDKRALL